MVLRIFLRSLHNVFSRTETRLEKNKPAEEVRQQTMSTKNVTAMLLQNFDENKNTEL